MTRLDQNRAQAHVAAKLGIPVNFVKNVIIWGNHSSTQFPDVRHAVAQINSASVPVYDAYPEKDYLKGDFVTVSSNLFIYFH